MHRALIETVQDEGFPLWVEALQRAREILRPAATALLVRHEKGVGSCGGCGGVELLQTDRISSPATPVREHARDDKTS